jgi:hypothetical protein
MHHASCVFTQVVVTVDEALTTKVLPLWYSRSVPLIHQVSGFY